MENIPSEISQYHQNTNLYNYMLAKHYYNMTPEYTGRMNIADRQRWINECHAKVVSTSKFLTDEDMNTIGVSSRDKLVPGIVQRADCRKFFTI